MELSPPAPRAGLQVKWMVGIITALILVVWWSQTPGGLLGKSDAIGYSVCHRIDARSFHLGDRPLPLCARCSGMYLGAFLGIVFQSVKGRRGGMPSRRVFALLGLLLLAFAVDGVNSYLHFFPGAPALYEPANWLRLVTGTGMGLALSAVLLPVFHQTMWRDWNSIPALGSLRQAGSLLLLAVILIFAVLWENPLVLYPLALLSAAGVVVLLTMVYSMVLVMLFKVENRFQQWGQLWLPIMGGLAITLVQVGIIDWGRFLLTHTWAGFPL